MGSGEDWVTWCADRTAYARGRHGPLSLTGTHWLHESERVPGIPGVWRRVDDRVVLADADGVVVDGAPADGTPLRPDSMAEPSEISYREKRLLLIEREGFFAVRVFDPDAEARRTFERIDAFGFDGAWQVPGEFRAYDETRPIAVPHVDGQDRILPLDGVVAFRVGEAEHSLEVSTEDGLLSAVFTDGTSGESTYGFRFVTMPKPTTGSGPTTIDFNRAYLPPCAFSPHYICPLPPPGNRLGIPITAGEKGALSATSDG